MNNRGPVTLISLLVFVFGFLRPAAAEPATGTAFNDKWAVVVGISKFSNPDLDLKYASKDARDFYDYLTTDGHFAPDHVALLLDEQATRKNILSAVGEKFLPAVVKPGDLVVIYFSGHGSPSDPKVGGVNYLITRDTNTEDVYGTGIAMQDFAKLIKDRVPTDKVVLVLDACHSGNVSEENKGLVREANLNAQQLAHETGRLIVSSSEPSQMSWESKDRSNGVFTHFLIEGLKHEGEQTTLADAFGYMKEKVQEEVLADRGAMQTPVMTGDLDAKLLALSSRPASPRSVPPELIPSGPAGARGAAAGAPAIADALPSTAAQQRLWQSHLESGQRAYQAGRYADAEKALAEALKFAGQFADQDPRKATTLNAVGRLKAAEGKYADAEPMLRKALSLREKIGGPDCPEVAETLTDLGRLLLDKGKYAEADAILRRSLSIREKAKGADSPQQAVTLTLLGRDLFEQGKYSQAEDASRSALAILDKPPASNSPELAESLVLAGRINMVNGRPNDARKILQRAMNMQERSLGSDHPGLIDSTNALAELYLYQDKLSEAEPLLYKSLSIAEQSLGADHPAVADCLDDLALIYELKIKYPQAESNFRRALDIREKALGPDNPAVGESLMNLAWLQYAQENYPQADSLFRKAQRVMEKSLDPENPKVITVLEYEGYLLRATSRRKQAAELARRVKAMQAQNKLENPRARAPVASRILSMRCSALAEKVHIENKQRKR